METKTLDNGTIQHTLDNWIGIQQPNESMAKTKWRRTDIEYYEVKSASKSKPGVVYTYTVTKNALGSLSCDCLGYRYRKNCRHIKEI
jgi:hypothetical protein|tara:strand:- start:30 stop:290 length:261 start_codon:yes stop_codon:yes gene_type:complete